MSGVLPAPSRCYARASWDENRAALLEKSYPMVFTEKQSATELPFSTGSKTPVYCHPKDRIRGARRML